MVYVGNVSWSSKTLPITKGNDPSGKTNTLFPTWVDSYMSNYYCEAKDGYIYVYFENWYDNGSGTVNGNTSGPYTRADKFYFSGDILYQ